MKKIAFFISVIMAFVLKVNAQEPQFVSVERQNRNVIIEELTGRNCQYCPDGHLIANNIVNDNPGRAWAVNIHSGGYSPTSYPNLNTSSGSEICNAFSSGGFPSGIINRSTSTAISRGEWTSNANKQLNMAAECNIGGQVVVNPETRVATVTVEIYYTGTSTSAKNYLTIMMLQDGIQGYQSGDYYNPAQIVNGQYNHMHVLRDVVTSTWGDEIAPTSLGSLVRKTYTYTIPNSIGTPNGVEVDIDDILFLAFVTEKQNGTATSPVLNVNQLSTIVGRNVNVTATVSPNDAGVVSGTGTYFQEDNVVLKATPKEGYKFLNWTENGEVVSTNAEYSFVIKDDRELVANFISVNYNVVTASVNPKDAGSVIGAATYESGESVSLTAIPSEGYVFVNWTENGNVVSEDKKYTFLLANDRDLVANFVLLNYDVDVTVNPEDSGEVMAVFFEESFEGGELPYGWDVYNENQLDPTDTPSEEQAWKVVDAYLELAPKDGEYYAASVSEWYYTDARLYLVAPKMKVPENVSMKFSYVNPKRDMYGSRLFVYASTSPIGPWTEVWSTMQNKSNSRWTDVEVDLAEYANQEVYFAFCNKFNGYGSWTAIDNLLISGKMTNDVALTCGHGDEVTLIATPNEGYRFANWTEDGDFVSADSKYFFTIKNDRDLIANFVPLNSKSITAFVNPKEAGEVVGTGAYSVNEIVTLTATANDGYTFVNWMENGKVISEKPKYSFVVKSDRNLVVNFAEIKATYNVAADVNPENAGIVIGSGVYAENDTVVVAAMPNEGYEFVNWTENDEVVSENAEYSFVILKDRNLVANFAEIKATYNVAADVNPENAGIVIGSGVYAENDTVVVVAMPNEGYEFVNWTENDEVVSENAEYSFVILKDRNLVANFVLTEGVDELTSLFRISPNPVNDKLYIAAEVKMEEVVLYDVYGRQQVVEASRCQESLTMDVSDLYSGVYFVRIKTDNGIITKQFIKQ